MIVLKGNSVVLREITEDDSDKVVRWRNTELDKGVFFSDEKLTLKTQKKWINKYLQNPSNITFIIEYNKQPIGMVALYHIQDNTAEFGRLLIGETEFRGKGIAKEASRMVLEYGFFDVGLQAIYAKVFADNESPLRLYYSLGFKVGRRELDSKKREILFLLINKKEWQKSTD